MRQPFKLMIVAVLLLCFSADAQELLVRTAAVPEYPRLALQAKVSGTVRFRVTIDGGTVSKIEPDPANPSNLRILQQAALDNIRGWSFYADKAVFKVEFTYELAKTEVVQPENPHVEMHLPHWVKLTAKPVTSNCNDCPTK